MNDTTELPDAIRLPLHRLWADAGYLIGRARQETDPERFVTIIKSRCEEIEAAYRADRAERAARSRVLRSWARTIAEFNSSFANVPRPSLMREIARHITPES